MSLEAARRWLDQHSDHLLTPYPPTARQLGGLLQKQADSEQILACVQHDPALTARLLGTVNRRRQGEPVESLEAAASLLGYPALLKLLQDNTHAPPDPTPEQEFLLSQLIDRSLHNAWQAATCAERLGYGELSSLRICARLMYLGELACCTGAPEPYREVWVRGGDEKAAQAVFGFDFSELGQLIAERERLPERVALAQPHHQNPDPKTRLLRLSTRLCRHCEQGWADERVTADLQQLAELMQRPIEEVASLAHRSAVEAARHSPCNDAWRPASRLVLTRDSHWAPETKPVARPTPARQATPERKAPAPKPSAPPPRGARTRDRLQQLLRSEDCTQSRLLQACLQGLHDELGFRRVSLFLLSRDRKMLHNRLSLGLDEQAPLRRYAVDRARAGLLARLLEKPLAVHIHPGNWQKYESLIPPSLLARLDSREFAAMSVFIGKQPIGLILADRKGAGEIASEDFKLFKQVVDLCARALALAAKHKK